MTAPEPPPSPSKAVDPLFVWDNKYLEQLRAIADTDEVPEALDWPALREAIKVQIIKVVEEFQGAPRSPWLHPAAREVAEKAAAAEQKKKEADGSSTGGGLNGSSSNGQDATASTSTSTADAAAAALEDRFASSSSASAAASTSAEQPTDAEADAPRSRRHSRQAARGLSEGSDGSAAPTSPGSDDEDFDLPDANDVNLDLSSTTTAADRSGYYPAKTAPPPTHNGSWGRLLTPAKQKEETYLCLQMLDGFESSPPFTIQRLAEVLLDPARFVRSAPKFTASLLRLLSVTAGHDDFPPVEPGVAPGAINTVMMTNSNGGGGGVDAGQQINGVGAVVGAVELQRMTGPPSPMAEPIFSPIPFLQRPRMEGGEGEGQGDQGDDVPTLELGELAHPAADAKAAGASAGAARSSNVVEPPPAPVVLQSATTASTSTAGQSGASSQPPPAAPLGLSGIGPSELPSSSSSSSSSQPLGVPPGRVDELDEYSGVANGTNPSTNTNTSNGGGGAGGPGDPSGQGSSSSATSASDGGSAAEGHQYGREVHPLSSTTTTTRAAPVDAVMADAEASKGAQVAAQGATTAAAAGGKGDEARMEEEEGDEGGHRAKRLKSEEPH